MSADQRQALEKSGVEAECVKCRNLEVRLNTLEQENSDLKQRLDALEEKFRTKSQEFEHQQREQKKNYEKQLRDQKNEFDSALKLKTDQVNRLNESLAEERTYRFRLENYLNSIRNGIVDQNTPPPLPPPGIMNAGGPSGAMLQGIPPSVGGTPAMAGSSGLAAARSQQQEFGDHHSVRGMVNEAEFEENMSLNRMVSSSAIYCAVSYVSAGDYAEAIDTLMAALSSITESKVTHDDRCKLMIGLLQDMLDGIRAQSFGSAGVPAVVDFEPGSLSHGANRYEQQPGVTGFRPQMGIGGSFGMPTMNPPPVEMMSVGGPPGAMVRGMPPSVGGAPMMAGTDSLTPPDSMATVPIVRQVVANTQQSLPGADAGMSYGARYHRPSCVYGQTTPIGQVALETHQQGEAAPTIEEEEVNEQQAEHVQEDQMPDHGPQ